MAILSLALSLVRQDPLDWGFLLAMGLYLAGWVLQADGFRQAWHFLRRNAGMLAAFLIVQAALILLLAALAGPQPFPWILLAMLALAAFLGRRGLRKIPAILWIFNLALLLYGWRINSWLFTAIGDDFAFFYAAREIALQQDLPAILGKFFDGLFVYGAHPYLSSLIQALSMKLVGVDSFGWRFSNAYLSALAIVFFYLFFKPFIGRTKSLLIAFLLAGSVYLLTFGKIGYNNLQAFFAMGLALWAAGWAVRAGSQRISSQGESTKPGLPYSVLGFSLGLCFYVYPAALYILPLPLLLVILFQSLKSRLTWRGIGLTGLALLLCLLPLLLQPDYWQSKSAGLIPNNPEIVQTGQEVALHIGANFLDAFYSFLYTPQETHFVPVGYVDPLTAALVLIGLALAFQRAPLQRFHLYALTSLLWLLIAAGVTHDRPFPPTTRMFLLLPWWAFLAVEALSWLVDQVSATRLIRWSKQGMLIVLVSLVISLNLYQAHILSPRRTAQYQSMETLFLGIVQRLGEFEPLRLEPLTFVFLTDQDWGIDGLHMLLQAYPYPASRVNIRRLKLEQPVVVGFYDQLVSERDTLVIIQPTLPPEWQVDLQAQLMALGKEGCEIKEVNGQDTRFTLWHSPELAPLCEYP